MGQTSWWVSNFIPKKNQKVQIWKKPREKTQIWRSTAK